jgi:hypothetical protein
MLRRRKTEIVQVNLRLREQFRQRLVGCAQRHGLSLNQEMVRRLEQSFEHEERQDLKEELKTTVQEEIVKMFRKEEYGGAIRDRGGVIRKKRSDSLVKTLREEYADHLVNIAPSHSLPPSKVHNKPKVEK